MICRVRLVLAALISFVAAFPASAAVNISTTSLPGAKVGVGYRAALVASGGTAPLRWKVLSGALPAGLFFAESAGVIVGVPERAANATLSVAVTDASGTAAEGKRSAPPRIRG